LSSKKYANGQPILQSLFLSEFLGKKELKEALPSEFTPGFMSLVRLVDELRIMKQVC
jgi:hypothetical protein